MLSIFLFTNDLRLQDNPALLNATETSDELVLLYCDDPALKRPNRFQSKSLGEHRARFLQQTLQDLSIKLKIRGQKLIIENASIYTGLSRWIEKSKANKVFSSVNAGFYENQTWLKLTEKYPYTQFEQSHSHTLFEPDQLPFELADLPQSFTKFRKLVENLPLNSACGTAQHLPKIPAQLSEQSYTEFYSDVTKTARNHDFYGGETAGLEHVEQYFNTTLPLNYKMVRNELDGWENSSKWSAWLANGSVSAKNIYQKLKRYERENGANDSTYWLYFELLWREYFQWSAHKLGAAIYQFRGEHKVKVLNSFYPTRFLQWSQGLTEFPIVNACMRHLNQTGYLSNRGRQIVASCLVNELQLDWRYGAAWFEQQLIDYDPAVNWGNWQYIAGVGADPRGGRHFNLKKQTQQYDPEHIYIDKWQGKQAVYSEYEDMVGWPQNSKN